MPTISLAKGRGEDVSRYRRFRFNNENSQVKNVLLLLKKRFYPLLNSSDIVPLSNINVVKHALLATVAEDNSDIERANFHWGMCKLILEEEKDAYRGMVKPKVNLDPTGQSGDTTVNML